MSKFALYVDKKEFLKLLNTKMLYMTDVDYYLEEASQKCSNAEKEYSNKTWVFSTNDILHRMDIEANLGNRDEIETDESKYQIIPYVTFTHTNDSTETSILKYSRGSKSGESRLMSKYSVGIGGHIEEAPIPNTVSNLFDCIYRGCIREIEEELNLPVSNTLKNYIRNKLASDSNFIMEDSPVGRVHLGIHINIDLSEVLKAVHPDEYPEINNYVNKLLISSGSMDVEHDIVEGVSLDEITPSILFDYNWESWSREVLYKTVF